MTLLVRAHGKGPRVLAEDFAGSAAISRAWVARSRFARAFAVDQGAPLVDLNFGCPAKFEARPRRGSVLSRLIAVMRS